MEVDNLMIQNWENAMLKTTKTQKKTIDFVDFKKAETTILRILSDTPYARWSHWVPSQNTGVECIGKDCPICEINRESKKAGQEKPYGQSRKYGVYVYNKNNGKIEVWDFGQTMYEDILSIMSDRRDDGKDMEFDIRIRNQNGKKKISAVEGDAPPKEVLDDFKDYPPVSERFIHLNKDQMVEFISGKTLKEIFNTKEQEEDNGLVLG